MKRWLKRGIIIIVSLAVLVIVWSFADAVLYKNEVREFVRDVEGIPLGAAEVQVQWIRTKYPVTTDVFSRSYYELANHPTNLQFCLLGRVACVFPRKLLLQDFGVDGSISLENGRVERKKISIGVNTSTGTGSFVSIEEAETMANTDPTDVWLNNDPSFRVGKRGGLTQVRFTPAATQERRRAAYHLDFRCAWKWRWCKAATDIVPELILPEPRGSIE